MRFLLRLKNNDEVSESERVFYRCFAITFWYLLFVFEVLVGFQNEARLIERSVSFDPDDAYFIENRGDLFSSQTAPDVVEFFKGWGIQVDNEPEIIDLA